MARMDLRLHAAFGSTAAAGAAAVVYIFLWGGLGLAMAAGSILVGLGYELVQAVRREGEPSWKDALATAAPGALAGAVYELARGHWV